MRALTAFLVFTLALGCESGAPMAESDAGAMSDAAARDASTPHDASAGDSGGAGAGIAPRDAVPGERLADDGETPLVAGDGDLVLRVDADPDEHVTFFLTFDRAERDVELEVLRWDGRAAVSLGVTDAGPGLRTLAVFDPSGPRTFYARVVTGVAGLDVTLTITRVPFADGDRCALDCAHLLQLPLPNDPRRDGYDTRPSTVFRYQYGRRDLLMFLRHAAQRAASLGMAPLVPEDLSQWDGATPGTDTGSLRHASHQRGKDVDISLHGLDGLAEWRTYCEPVSGASGRECRPGTVMNYDGRANAIWFAELFATGRVTMCFLDRELIEPSVIGAEEASLRGEIPEALVPVFDDGVHLQHWPNHDNHIHVRVSESESATALEWRPGMPLPVEPFEAP